jgi:hypothetical protein
VRLRQGEESFQNLDRVYLGGLLVTMSQVMDCVEQFHSAIVVVVAKVLFGWPVQRGYIERDFAVIHLDAHAYREL